MAKPTAVGFRPNTARRILRRAGGASASQIPEYTRPGGGGAINVKFFQLTQDVAGPTASGKPVQWIIETESFTAPDPDEDATPLVNWAGLIDHAVEGDIFQFVLIDDNWCFLQGPCIPAPEP